jgi:nucleoside-diphosphate-sugar epimerase
MLAAARGEPYEISFGGGCQMHYAGDVARAFIAAARSDVDGAEVYDVGGPTVQLRDVVDAIRLVAPEEADRISIAGDALPFPEHIPDDGIGVLLNGAAPTSLGDGVAETVQRFRDLIASGMMAESSTSSNVVR